MTPKDVLWGPVAAICPQLNNDNNCSISNNNCCCHAKPTRPLQNSAGSLFCPSVEHWTGNYTTAHELIGQQVVHCTNFVQNTKRTGCSSTLQLSVQASNQDVVGHLSVNQVHLVWAGQVPPSSSCCAARPPCCKQPTCIKHVMLPRRLNAIRVTVQVIV